MGFCFFGFPVKQFISHKPVISIICGWESQFVAGYPLVICYIAIENGPFIVDLPIKDGDFL